MNIRKISTVLVLCLCLAPALPGALGAAELVVFRSDSCAWCVRWEREVGVVYDKTDEARLAPVRRIDVHDARPTDLAAVKGVTYTPTFVLMDHGRELGRITGYPGEENFWGLLDEMLGKLPKPAQAAGGCPQGDATPC